MILPHEPHVFDSGGNKVAQIRYSLDTTVGKKAKREYIGQLKFTNTKILAMVDALLSSKEPPMIIIQSDHGPDHSVEGSWFNINEHFIKERMGNLNVIYLPEEEYGLLYDTFSPVNTFRLFFKLYIDDTYTLLEDKSYFSDVKRYPYAFMEVKNKRSKEYFFNETLYNDLYLSS